MPARLVDRYLDPSESLLEILFGLIMALTMTAGARLVADPATLNAGELAAALAGFGGLPADTVRTRDRRRRHRDLGYQQTIDNWALLRRAAVASRALTRSASSTTFKGSPAMPRSVR